jgi:hypothetical protein
MAHDPAHARVVTQNVRLLDGGCQQSQFRFACGQGTPGYSPPMRLIEWLSDVAQRFDAALEWQEADDLLV